jgi:hypothetical protein
LPHLAINQRRASEAPLDLTGDRVDRQLRGVEIFEGRRAIEQKVEQSK